MNLILWNKPEEGKYKSVDQSLLFFLFEMWKFSPDLK